MQLIQFNWFLDKGLLQADPATARLTIDYDRTPTHRLAAEGSPATAASGDKAAAAAFFKQWTTWTPGVHEKLAERIRRPRARAFGSSGTRRWESDLEPRFLIRPPSDGARRRWPALHLPGAATNSWQRRSRLR